MKYLIICNQEMQFRLGNITCQEELMNRRIRDLEKAVKHLTNDKIWYQPYSLLKPINSTTKTIETNNNQIKTRIDNLENKLLVLEKVKYLLNLII